MQESSDAAYAIAYNKTITGAINYLKPVGYFCVGLGVISDIALTANGQQTVGETAANTGVSIISICAGGWVGILVSANWEASKAYMKAIEKHPEYGPWEYQRVGR